MHDSAARSLRADSAGPDSTQTSHPTGMLRPQALPTDTTIRFLLLIATVAVASLNMFNALWFVLRGEAFINTVVSCGIAVDPLTSGSVADTGAALSAQSECRSTLSTEQVVFSLAGVAIVFSFAYLIYRLRPQWREKRAHLVPLDPTEGFSLLAEVDSLSRAAGLPRPPDVLVDAVNPAVQGFVYGSRGRPRLGITGGLLVQQAVDPQAFRAVLRHELAHLANRDVPWTYFTLSVWWSFVTVALLPITVVLAVSDLQYVFRLGWRMALLALLVLLVRNSVLRAREVYADARAAAWGSRADLDGLLAAEPAPQGRRHRLLRLHPTVAQRRTLLADSDGLFATDVFVAAAAGASAGIALMSIGAMAALVLPFWAANLLSAFLVAPLLAGVICVSAWRCGLRAVVRGTQPPVAWPLALGVGAGLAVAPWLAFEAAAGGGSTGTVGYLLWAVGTILLIGPVSRYAADAGRIAVEAGLRRPSPWFPLALNALAVGAWVAVLLMYGKLALVMYTPVDAGLARVVTGGAVPTVNSYWEMAAYLPFIMGPGDDALLVIAAVCILTVAPLLTRRILLRTHDAHTGDWAFGDSQPHDLSVSKPPKLGVAFTVGAVAGAVAVLGYLAARFAGAGLLEDAVWRSDAYRASLYMGTVTLLAVSAGIGAIGGAIAVDRYWWPVGLLSGATALTVGAAGVIATNVATGCGLLPRLGPPDCTPPTVGMLEDFWLRPLGFAAAGTALAACVVGLIRALPLRLPSSLPSAVVLVIALTAVSSTGLVARVASTRIDTVSGPGYEIALPPLWQATEAPDSVPVLLTQGERLRATLIPIPEPSLPQGGQSLQVGGVEARFVGLESQGGLEVHAFDMVGPSGAYRLLLVGAPAVFDEGASDELLSLLDAVSWTGEASS